jgi:hypothetical protein
VQKALDYEIRRQIKAVAAGDTLVQETRLWNADQEITLSMRSKEYAHDYRYFPEPDLVPLVIDPTWTDEIRSSKRKWRRCSTCIRKLKYFAKPRKRRRTDKRQPYLTTRNPASRRSRIPHRICPRFQASNPLWDVTMNIYATVPSASSPESTC